MKPIPMEVFGQRHARSVFLWSPKLTSKCHLIVGLVFFGLLAGTGRLLGAEEGDVSPEERELGIKLIGGDQSVATNQGERFCALGSAARKMLREGKINEAEALATELLRLKPKYKQDWNYGNAIADANQVLGQIALLKGDVTKAKRHLLASAEREGSPQLNSFGPSFVLARELAEKGEREVAIAFLDAFGPTLMSDRTQFQAHYQRAPQATRVLERANPCREGSRPFKMVVVHDRHKESNNAEQDAAAL